MNKYKGILLCSDLDGTLRNSKGTISKENLDAIEYFCSEGGLFTLCTGRNPSHTRTLLEAGLKINTALVALNGAMIYDLKKNCIVYDNPMEKSKLSDIDGFIEDNKKLIFEVVFHSLETRERFCEIGEDKLYKVVFVSKTAEDSRKLRKKLSAIYENDFFITNSWPEGLELLAKTSTKGDCLKIIKNHIIEKITKTVCIGDFENDITMLKAADVSFAVENALPEVKKEARYVTVSNDENALAEIIRRF